MDATLFSKYQLATKSRDTERGELLKLFQENINVTRVGQYKPLSLVRIATYLKGKTISQLYELSSKCRQNATRNKPKYFETYAKTFFWELKK